MNWSRKSSCSPRSRVHFNLLQVLLAPRPQLSFLFPRAGAWPQLRQLCLERRHALLQPAHFCSRRGSRGDDVDILAQVGADEVEGEGGAIVAVRQGNTMATCFDTEVRAGPRAIAGRLKTDEWYW